MANFSISVFANIVSTANTAKLKELRQTIGGQNRAGELSDEQYDERLELIFDRVAAAKKEEEGDDTPVVIRPIKKTWTDREGKRQTANLVEASGPGAAFKTLSKNPAAWAKTVLAGLEQLICSCAAFDFAADFDKLRASIDAAETRIASDDLPEIETVIQKPRK